MAFEQSSRKTICINTDVNAYRIRRRIPVPVPRQRGLRATGAERLVDIICGLRLPANRFRDLHTPGRPEYSRGA